MINSNYISLGSVIWSVLKNPLAAELTYEEAAEYSLEAIKLLGSPVIYLSKIYEGDLLSHKLELPCDLLYIEGVRYYDGSNDGIPMREATNTFHMNPDEFNHEGNTDFDLRGNHRRNEYTYKIQKGILFSSIPEGCIEIAYKAIALDEDGYPLIPDHQRVQLALEYYILSRYLEPLWMMGKITDKAFEYVQQKRYFYVASAQTGLPIPTVDKMESIMNGVNKLIINTNAHKNAFKKYGEKEALRKYR